MRSRALIVLAAFLPAFLADAAEVLLHTGPTVTVEVDSIASPTVTSEAIVFVKQFFIDAEMLAKLPAPHPPSTPAAVTPERAVELAKATIEPGAHPVEINAKTPELLRSTPTGSSHPVEYYLIELHMEDASEHRIVLMNGTVLKPRLKRVPTGK